MDAREAANLAAMGRGLVPMDMQPPIEVKQEPPRGSRIPQREVMARVRTAATAAFWPARGADAGKMCPSCRQMIGEGEFVTFYRRVNQWRPGEIRHLKECTDEPDDEDVYELPAA